jgi:hypothetical protein
VGFVVCRGPEVEASGFSGRGDLRILEACLADTVQENSGRQLCEVVSKCRPLFWILQTQTRSNKRHGYIMRQRGRDALMQADKFEIGTLIEDIDMQHVFGYRYILV